MRKTLIFISRFTLFIFAVLAFSSPASAASLSEYRENISHLRDDLNLMISPKEDSTDAENLAFEREVLAEFPKLLPAQDKIEWQGASVEVNNQWIYDTLGRFESEPPKSTKRTAILIEISERLSALEVKINELEAVTTAERTKDEDKRKLAEILQREEYQKPEEKQESLFEKIWNKITEWLNNTFPRPTAPSVAPVGGFDSFTFVLQMILYAVILSVIGFLIYRFAPFFVSKYRRKEKREKKERVILGERLAADETAQNLFDEAERLAREGNLRGAIRKGYIALLCELSDRKIIGLSQHKTNRDYLRDVRKQNELYKNMSGLTNNYERHWYGFDAAQESDWEEFRSEYRKAVAVGSGSRQ